MTTELFSEFVEDSIAWADLVGLSDALAAELVRRQLPTLTENLVLAGAAVSLDYIEGPTSGFSFARLGSGFQTNQFPFPQQTYVPGAGLQIARQFELGIARGITLPEDGSPMTRDEWFEVSRLAMADMNAIAATICSYFGSRAIPFVVSNWIPLGPDGGVVGGSWTVSAGSAF